VTWQAYGESLEEKLKDLHDRVHRGSYRARPARRTYIRRRTAPSGPLSILCLEDKIVQQAVVYVLEAIYEEDFLASRMDSDQGAASTMRWTLSTPGFTGSK